MNGYELHRNWFDWAFENPEKVTPGHTAVYLFAVEWCNRLAWKDKFGFPSQMAMDAVGIRKHETFIKYFNDLTHYYGNCFCNCISFIFFNNYLMILQKLLIYAKILCVCL